MAAQVRIVVDALGRGTIEIAGRDVSHLVSGFTLSSRVGDVTRITLEVPAVMVELDAGAVAKLAEIVAKSQEQSDG